MLVRFAMKLFIFNQGQCIEKCSLEYFWLIINAFTMRINLNKISQTKMKLFSENENVGGKFN